MGTVTAGRGTDDAIDGNYSGYTIVDTQYPAAANFSVTTIKILFNYISGGYDLPIGCGTLSGNTFTPRAHVHFDTSSWPERFPFGLVTLTAPGDFTAFSMQAGDLIFGYFDSDELAITQAATPEGLGYVEGNVHAEASFVVTPYSIETPLWLFSGPGAAKGGRILMVGVG